MFGTVLGAYKIAVTVANIRNLKRQKRFPVFLGQNKKASFNPIHKLLISSMAYRILRLALPFLRFGFAMTCG